MYKHLLLAIDLADAEAQHKAVQSAIACCRSFGAQLSVITVVPDFGMSMVAGFFPKNYQQNALKETDKALKAYAEKHFPEDIQVHRIVAHGTIYREIIFHAERRLRPDRHGLPPPGAEDYLWAQMPHESSAMQRRRSVVR